MHSETPSRRCCSTAATTPARGRAATTRGRCSWGSSTAFDLGFSRPSMPRSAFALAALFLLSSFPGAAQFRVAPPGDRPDVVALELVLRKLSSTGTFMQTDAHPDDEDNGLLAMVGLGQGMRATLV